MEKKDVFMTFGKQKESEFMQSEYDIVLLDDD